MPTRASATRRAGVAERRQRPGAHHRRAHPGAEQLVDRRPGGVGEGERDPEGRLGASRLQCRDRLTGDTGELGEVALGDASSEPCGAQALAALAWAVTPRPVHAGVPQTVIASAGSSTAHRSPGSRPVS